MKVVIRSRERRIGEVSVGPDDVVQMDDGAKRFLGRFNVVEPNTLRRLTPEHGRDYVAALPQAVSGSYVFADMVDPL